MFQGIVEKILEQLNTSALQSEDYLLCVDNVKGQHPEA